MSDYFTEMGKMLAAQMARDPATRDRADAAIRRHLGMATDAMPRSLSPRYGRDQDPEMPPRGSNFPDPSDAPITAEECISSIQMMLQHLSGPDRDALIGALHELLTEEPGNGGSEPNAGALDQRPRRPSARDRQAQDAAFAARARNTANFLKRWPQLQNLEVWR